MSFLEMMVSTTATIHEGLSPANPIGLDYCSFRQLDGLTYLSATDTDQGPDPSLPFQCRLSNTGFSGVAEVPTEPSRARSVLGGLQQPVAAPLTCHATHAAPTHALLDHRHRGSTRRASVVDSRNGPLRKRHRAREGAPIAAGAAQMDASHLYCTCLRPLQEGARRRSPPKSFPRHRDVLSQGQLMPTLATQLNRREPQSYIELHCICKPQPQNHVRFGDTVTYIPTGTQVRAG